MCFSAKYQGAWEQGLRVLALAIATGLLGFRAEGGSGPPATLPETQPTAGVETRTSPIVASDIQSVPTIRCIGLYWPVRGDPAGRASAQVAYRVADSRDWKPAFPLWRVAPQPFDLAHNRVGGFPVWFARGLSHWEGIGYSTRHWDLNYLAGSIFNLEPDTDYDIQVALTDPDGGKTVRTLRVKTRPVPAIPAAGHRIAIGGGGGALREALRAAGPGDDFLVHGGTYDAIAVAASGTPERPITIQPAGDGDVVIQGAGRNGIQIDGSYVYVQGLTISGFPHGRGIQVASRTTNVAVMRCHVTGCYTGIEAGGQNGYYADNVVRGLKEASDYQGDFSEGHGIEIYEGQGGQGTVICYNAISHVADAVRIHCSDADVYGNDQGFDSDDALETDDGGPNLRIFANRFWNTGRNGISFQPYIGGPCYLLRNVVVDGAESPIKDRYKSSGAVFVNNTFVAEAAASATLIPERSFARNNLFISTRREAVEIHAEDLIRQPTTLNFDYDGFAGLLGFSKWFNYGQYENLAAREPWRQFQRSDLAPATLADFSSRTALEKHGVALSVTNCFDAWPTGLDIQRWITQWKGSPPDLSLKAGSAAIDKGVVVANLADTYCGKAPDLGAIEFGAVPPHWGPR